MVPLPKSHTVCYSQDWPHPYRSSKNFRWSISLNLSRWHGEDPLSSTIIQGTDRMMSPTFWRSLAMGMPVPTVLFLEPTPHQLSLSTPVACVSWAELQTSQICAASIAGLGTGGHPPRKPGLSAPRCRTGRQFLCTPVYSPSSHLCTHSQTDAFTYCYSVFWLQIQSVSESRWTELPATLPPYWIPWNKVIKN